MLSSESGRKANALSIDHKPSSSLERKRIIESGGQIYQTVTVASMIGESNPIPEIIIGPIRVFPGRLSVSRTFGDPEAKIFAKGGNPNVVVSTPEIWSFKIDSNLDFIILGWDGIFDKLDDREWVDWVWNSVHHNPGLDVHHVLGLGAEWIMKNALNRRSLDNVTVVIVAFSGFKDAISLLNNKSSLQEDSDKSHIEKNLRNKTSSKSQRSSSQNHTLASQKDF